MSSQYPYKIFREKVNGKDVSIVGVEHTVEFFFKHEFFFENVVMQNDAIIIERNDDGSTDLGNSGGFYFPLNRIALGQNKRAYVTDPINPGSSTLDFIFSLSPLAIVADDAIKTIRSLRKKENFPNKDTPKVSR